MVLLVDRKVVSKWSILVLLVSMRWSAPHLYLDVAVFVLSMGLGGLLHEGRCEKSDADQQKD